MKPRLFHHWQRLSNCTGMFLLFITAFMFMLQSNTNAQNFSLDMLESAEDGRFSLTVPPSNEVAVTLITTGHPAKPVKVKLHLNQFTSPGNRNVTVKMKLPSLNDTIPDTDKSFTLRDEFLKIILHADSLPSNDNYTGRLILSSNDKQLKIWEIILSKTGVFTPAELIVDQREITREINKPFFGGQEDYIFLTVREKTRQWPLNGITVVIENTVSTSGVIDHNNFTVLINGEMIDNYSSWPPVISIDNNSLQYKYRTIPVNGIATIKLGLKNLPYGKHSVTLKFRAENSTVTETQGVVLNLTVRHSIWWAILVLFFAVGFSFFCTKFISNFRQRSMILKKISDMYQSWLRNEPAYLPVIWVRAMLRQYIELCSKGLFTSGNLIEEKVNRVNEVVILLKKIRDTRILIDNLEESDLTKKRLKLELNKIVTMLGSDPVDDECKVSINEKLDDLRSMMKIDNITVKYWSNFKVSLDDLLSSISLGDIANTRHAKVFKGLMDTLYQARKTEPKDMNEIAAIEAIYSRLKILWARRDSDELNILVDNIQKQKSLESFFTVADTAIWKKMKKTKLIISLPSTGGSANLKTYEPLLFTLMTSDPIINNSYLFTRGLRYEWEFKMCKSKPGKIEDKPEEICAPLKPVTLEPKVVQFTPMEGYFKTSVTIKYKDDSITLNDGIQMAIIKDAKKKVEKTELEYKEEIIPISKSDSHRWLKWLSTTEYISICISLALSIITGLSVSYFSQEGFGSLQNYITLFLWGAGIDQSKNALQILQEYSGGKTES